MKMKRPIALLLALALLIAVALPAAAAPREFGSLYYDGQVVRTHVVPAALPHGGIDPLYSFTNGVEGQFSVSAVGPGDPDYHGGRWAIYEVTWNDGATPTLLTSDAEVLAAEAAGELTITRTPEADNRCPIHP
jgi:hypothetical protein